MARVNQIPSYNQYRKPRTMFNANGALLISDREKKRIRDINKSIKPVGEIDGWFPDMETANVIVQNIAENYDFIDWLIVSHESSNGKIGDAAVVDFLKKALKKSMCKGEFTNEQEERNCKEDS